MSGDKLQHQIQKMTEFHPLTFRNYKAVKTLKGRRVTILHGSHYAANIRCNRGLGRCPSTLRHLRLL